MHHTLLDGARIGPTVIKQRSCLCNTHNRHFLNLSKICES